MKYRIKFGGKKKAKSTLHFPAAGKVELIRACQAVISFLEILQESRALFLSPDLPQKHVILEISVLLFLLESIRKIQM